MLLTAYQIQVIWKSLIYRGLENEEEIACQNIFGLIRSTVDVQKLDLSGVQTPFKPNPKLFKIFDVPNSDARLV